MNRNYPPILPRGLPMMWPRIDWRNGRGRGLVASVPTTGLVAHYKLNEGTGTTAADSSGSANHATLGIGGSFLPTWNARGIVLPNLSLLIPPPGLHASATTKMWFAQMERSANYQGISGVGPGGVTAYGNSGSGEILYGNVDAPDIQTLRGVNGNCSVAIVGGTPSKIYVNGAEASYLQQGNVTFGAATGTDHWIGYAGGAAFRKEIWYALYWDRALSAAEILSAHSAVASTLSARSVTLSGGFQTPNVVFLGDSRTLSATTSAAGRYPTVAMTGRTSPWANHGVGGATAGAFASGAAAKGVTALVGASPKVAVVWYGTNDLAAATGQLNTVKTNLAAGVAILKAAGAHVIILTEIDRNVTFGGGQTQAGYRTDVSGLNTWINAGSSGADAVADVGALSQLQDADDTTYFTDKVHLTTAGAALVAGVVDDYIVAAGVA